MTADQSAALDVLERRLPGRVGRRGSTLYEAGRRVFFPPARTREPLVVVKPADAHEVAAVLRWASEYDTRVSIRSGGHSFDGLPVRAGVALMDLTGMDRVEVRGAQRLHAMPGARLKAVAAALAQAGRLLPHGDCATVGLGGLATGGGFGYSSRRYGLTLDALAEATLVTPDGQISRTSATEEPDLFWSCRGGAGCTGIVTQLVFDTHAVGNVTGMTLAWRWEAAAEAVLLYDGLLREADTRLDLKLKLRTTGAERFMDTASAGPDDAIAGTPLVHIDGQFLGGRDEAEALLAPLLRHPAAHRIDLREEGYYDAMLQLVPLSLLTDPAPATLRPTRVASDFTRGPLNALHAGAIVGFVDALQNAPGLRGGGVVIEPANGAVADLSAAATAFPHRDADLLLEWELFGAPQPTRNEGEQQDGALAEARRALAAVLTGGRYVNYADRLDTPAQWWGENLPRLCALAEACDPNGVLVSRLRP